MAKIILDISDEMEKQLDTYCMITGKTREVVLCEILQTHLQIYKADDEPIPALYLEGNSEYERTIAANEGREPKITVKPCFVLNETSIFGEPKYRIMVDDEPMTVNRDDVRFEGTAKGGDLE